MGNVANCCLWVWWVTERPVNHPLFSPSSCLVQISFLQRRQIGKDFNNRPLFLACWLWYSSAREKSYAVYGCFLQCVCRPAGLLLHCTSQTASGSQVCRTVAVLPPQLRKLYSLQHLHENIFLHRLVPEQIPFKHSCEGPDDMPAHAKVTIAWYLLLLEQNLSTHQACLLGSNLTLPICDGRVTLGTWQVIKAPYSKDTFQGVWLCEHRDRAGPRKVLVTVNGVIRDPIRWFSFSSPVNTSLITVVRYIGFIQLHPNELWTLSAPDWLQKICFSISN